MKLNKRKTAVAGGALGLVLAGVGLSACSGGDGSGSAPAVAATSATPSASASAAPASTGDSVSASGTVQSARVRELGFTTGGVITKLNVKVGSKVAKGDLLGTVDSTVAQESLSAAYTAYVAAEKNYKEVKSGKTSTKTEDTENSDTSDTSGNGTQGSGNGSGNGNGTQGSDTGTQGSTGTTQATQTTAEAYAALVKAKNAYTKAQREVAGTKVYAPFAGTITALSGTVDKEVGSGSTVFTLTDVKNLRVNAEFSEADTTLLKKGQKATVTFDSLEEKISGQVLSVSPIPVSSSSSTSSGQGGGGGFQASSTSVVRYEVLVSLSKVPAKARVGGPVTVEVRTG